MLTQVVKLSHFLLIEFKMNQTQSKTLQQFKTALTNSSCKRLGKGLVDYQGK